jgi:hypothetical protein
VRALKRSHGLSMHRVMRNIGSTPDLPEHRPDHVTVPLPTDYIAPRLESRPESSRELVLALLRDVGIDRS